MEREIKFRALDKSNSRIVNAESIDFVNNQLHFLSETFKGNPTFINEYILMQYTGLKDKNGVEIYEGDIVKHSVHLVENDIIKSIEYFDGSFIAKPTYEGSQAYMSLINFAPCRTMEVIGNIYENPELLKD